MAKKEEKYFSCIQLFLSFHRLFTNKKIRRGPKLEGYAFANFEYSSETDEESLLRIKNDKE